MNKEQLIATLQACYFGDKGAYNLILEKFQELEQENNQLKLDFELYKDNHIYKNYEVERKDRVLKELRSWLEEHYDFSDCIRIKSVLDKLNELEGGKNE